MASDYHIEVVSEGVHLGLALTGRLTPANAEGVTRALIAKVQAGTSRRVLLDLRGLKGRLPVAEIYHVVTRYAEDARPFKTALIDHPRHAATSLFHEDVSVNRGLPMRYFTDPAAALAWLLA
jgi:hypothetical protein